MKLEAVKAAVQLFDEWAAEIEDMEEVARALGLKPIAKIAFLNKEGFAADKITVLDDANAVQVTFSEKVHSRGTTHVEERVVVIDIDAIVYIELDTTT